MGIKRWRLISIILIILISITYFYYYITVLIPHNESMAISRKLVMHRNSSQDGRHFLPEQKLNISLALVGCGNNLENLETLIKSTIIFSQHAHLHLFLITDMGTMSRMKILMQNLEKSAKQLTAVKLTYEIKLTAFPYDGRINWAFLFKKCSAQRLFLPSLLSHVDSVIYLDTDTIVLGNLSHLWSQIFNMDDTQLLAAAPDTKRAYNEHRKFSFVMPTGLNAGVLLMNLTRLRRFDFEKKIRDVAVNYGDYLSDQDLLNIYFHDHPEQYMGLSCSYNFWNGHCVTTESFYDEELRQEGVHVLHGASRQFPKKLFRPFSIFSTIYKSMKHMELKDSPQDLLKNLTKQLNNLYFNCKADVTTEILLRNAEEYFANLLK